MSYYTGTVNGTNELLDVIKSNAIVGGYTVNRDRVEGTPNSRELFMTSVNGAVIGFKVIVTENISSGDKIYPDNVCLALNVGKTYDDLATFENQPDSYSTLEIDNIGAFCRENMTITYHLSITAGRIFCAYSLDGYWFTFYAGNFFPYDTPLNFTTPFFLAGNSRSDSTEDYLSSMGSLYNIVGHSQAATGSIDNFGNWIYNSITNNWTSTTYKLCIEPFGINSGASEIFAYNKDGSYTFMPVILANNETGYCFGELDGVYRIASYGIKSGDIINDGVNDYLAFKKDIFGPYYNGMFAIKLI